MTRVLFVCVHNAGRSQMAEAFFNKRAAELGIDAVATSVGTAARGEIHPVVMQAMQEAGISLEGKRPRQIMEWDVNFAQRVITMHCGIDPDHCPVNLGLSTEDWGLDDPANQPIEKVREIRDEIERRVDGLLDEIAAAGAKR